ncbi:superoxide dismutase [Alkalibacillus haloalkaliphilus]|uniref:superoxide dismutase n=1 Tax=Alkalibacillus haloalkaliphilus TaxID=94136 RepID=A0A511W1Y2_9BACI|nr:superoxide dismutase [Alkalibacillus haloalkaliphilus]GEN45065.1 superoxide dismutase [Alkalibacillus haloalkaliphilus]
MSQDTLSQFVYELEEWVSDLNDKWQRFKLEQGDELNEELSNYDQNLNKFVEAVRNYQERQEMLSHDIAQELQSEAAYLFHRWNELFKSDHKGKEQSNDHNRFVPIGGHELPPLPYAYDALEPYIDERIMRLHHDKHHQSYVDGLNKAEREMQKARQTGDFDLIKHWEREAAFNGAGHYLHTIFWNIMSPEGGGEPSGELLNAINESFGSYDQFKEHFSEAAKNVEGVGWSILVWSPRSHRLEILQAERHQDLSQWDVIPLLVLDVWEHAYYLQYENDRDAYVDVWWNIVNWDEVESRFNTAREVKWEQY